MKNRKRLIAILACCALLLGGAVVSMRSLPFLAQIAAHQAATSLKTGSFASPVWEESNAEADYREIVSGLGEAGFVLQSVKVVSADSGTVTFEWNWDPPVSVGDRDPESPEAWIYQTQGQFSRAGALWKVNFDPSLVHPDLKHGDRLSAQRTAGSRGRVLGADKEVLVDKGTVVDVGLHPAKMTGNPSPTFDKLAKVLDVDKKPLEKKVASADKDAFVPVITLRDEDYQLVKADIYKLPGTVFREREQSLSRTKGFAAATLGSVSRAAPGEVDDDPTRLSDETEIGRSGIQKEFDDVLRPGLGTTVIIEEGDHSKGNRTRVLQTFKPQTGQDVQTTIDVATQAAAEDAAKTQTKPTAIVAIRPSNGHVIAVANHDDEGAGWDRALQGQYPPGSVFKIASGLAMLDGGVKQSSILDCPKTTSVQGKSFKNAEDHVLGRVTFRQSFAESCNTAFINGAAETTSAEVAKTASGMGMTSADIGTDAFMADVPTVDDPVEHAASMIGQGKVLASPLGVATMAASVKAGHSISPVLIPIAQKDKAASNANLDTSHLEEVRAMMRAAVTEGTASELNDVLGKPVFGKTGTAEYGAEVPPRTHSWFAGFQGDVAVAVLVEDGGFGAQAAVPVAKRFFQEINS